jgi:hypothetical protein
VWAFSGVDTTADPLDQSNSNHALGSTTVQPGSVTPGSDGQLVIAHETFDSSASMPTVNSSFTTPAYGDLGTGGVYLGSGSSYLIQTTAAAVNPTFTKPASGNLYATIATFEAGAAGPVNVDADPAALTLTGQDVEVATAVRIIRQVVRPAVRLG